jgi:hypothetical protein
MTFATVNAALFVGTLLLEPSTFEMPFLCSNP